MINNLHTITDDEWTGWHGALSWPNGDRPLYAESDEFVLVIGCENGELHYQGPNPKNSEMEFGEARIVFSTEGMSAQDIRNTLQDLMEVLTKDV